MIFVEPPYFIQTLLPKDVKEGDDICMSCHIGGTREIQVSWFKGNSKVLASTTCKMEYSDGFAYLKLTKTTKSDTGEYTCRAENRIGSSSCACYLTVKGDSHFILLFDFYLKNPQGFLKYLK